LSVRANGRPDGPNAGIPPKGMFTPARLLAVGFALVIAAGTLLLLLPFSTEDGRGLRLLDAFFTATSALCVTGLTVIDVGATLSTFGELVVLALIQVGGLGVMTVTTLFALALGRRISLRGTVAVGEALGYERLAAGRLVAREVMLMTVLVEAAGTFLLTLCFSGDMPLGRAAYFGVFHAVSAFCNAGFDLFGTSLVGYVTNVPANFIFMTLIIIGGLGFTVVAELLGHLPWRTARNGTRRRLSLHTTTVLKTSALLTLVAILVILAFEWNNPVTLGSLPPGGRVLAAVFQAITPRTAGFNTVPTGALLEPTLLFLMFLMFVGASPGSTGGGVKTTTLATMFAAILSGLRRREDVELGERRLPNEVALKAWIIATLGLGLVMLATLVLLMTEKTSLMAAAFEAVSAFGTVGLSTGITPELSPAGRLFLPLVMYAGRLGPLTLAVALARQRPVQAWRLPEERVIVG